MEKNIWKWKQPLVWKGNKYFFSKFSSFIFFKKNYLWDCYPCSSIDDQLWNLERSWGLEVFVYKIHLMVLYLPIMTFQIFVAGQKLL